MQTLEDIALIIGGISFLTVCLLIVDAANNAVDSFWKKVGQKKSSED